MLRCSRSTYFERKGLADEAVCDDIHWRCAAEWDGISATEFIHWAEKRCGQWRRSDYDHTIGNSTWKPRPDNGCQATSNGHHSRRAAAGNSDRQPDGRAKVVPRLGCVDKVLKGFPRRGLV
jgi:hypothetical protein